MSYQVFSAMEWVYPDFEIKNGGNKADLSVARNASECFQILTNLQVKTGESIRYSFSKNENFNFSIFQLMPAHVPENCAKEIFTTKNYDEVKDFVTRKAPFDVFEICCPIKNNQLRAGRCAFYVRVDVKQNAKVGIYN